MMEQNSNSIFLFLERANYQPNTDFYWFPYKIIENFNLDEPKKSSTDFVKYEWGKTATLVAFWKHCGSPCWWPSHASSLCCSVIILTSNTCMSLPESFFPKATRNVGVPCKYPGTPLPRGWWLQGVCFTPFLRVSHGNKSQLPTVVCGSVKYPWSAPFLSLYHLPFLLFFFQHFPVSSYPPFSWGLLVGNPN